MKYLKEVYYLLEGDKRKVPLMMLLFLMMSILDVVGIGLVAPYAALIISPSIISEKYPFLLDLGIPSNPNDMLIYMSILLVLIFILKAAGMMLINWSIFSFCYKRQISLRSDLMALYQLMPYLEHTKRNTAEYIHNLGLVTTFTQGILVSLFRLISEGIVVVFVFLFLLSQDVSVVLVLMVLLISFTFFYDFLFGSRLKKYGKLSNIYSTGVLRAAKEGLGGLKEVRILQKEKYFYDKFYDNVNGFADVAKKSDFISSIPRFLLELLMILFVVSMVIVYSIQDKDMGLLVPVLTMFSVAAIRLFPSVNQITSGISRMRYGRDAVSLLCNDLKKKYEFNIENQFEVVNPAIPSSKFESIELKNVSFSYNSVKSKEINDVTLRIKKGDSIGIIGQSGSGKTTLVDILLGLISIDEGEVLYNGTDLEGHLDDWRSNVAYIPQNIFIIDDTLRRNIALGVPDDKMNNTKLQEAIQQAQLDELCSNIPNGLEATLGEGGVCLSGGQRQRVALARAFYHDRNVLVMDEATSALDVDTENEVVNEIKNLKQEGSKTIIIIAHRLSIISHCDYVYKIENGSIVSQGSYDTVVNTN